MRIEMSFRVALRCIGFVLLVASSAAGKQRLLNSDPVVRTQAGFVRGILQPSHGGAAFKGVPYARPPVGILRWREPQPLKPWTGVRDSAHFAPACMQNPLGTGIFVAPVAAIYGARYQAPKISMSEDCLYLNIWTPEWPVRSPLPVMVWIHGGSNVMGSGSETTYDGSKLAQKGVIVVTINYRLGVFGFFSHPGLTQESPHHASGNYGLMDQIAALEWVHDNISGFGGDLGRVTVFGESAGAIDIGVLMCSPLAQGLFQRAIMESGPVLAFANDPAPREKEEQSGAKFATWLGVGQEAPLEELRAIPAATLFEKADTYSKTNQISEAMIDGWVLRSSPAEVFADSRQLPVDFIIGNNGREMSAFRLLAGAGPSNSGGNEGLRKTLSIFYGHADSVVGAFFVVDNTLKRTAAADSWFNDAVAVCPEMGMATLQNRTGHRAYIYQFLRSIPGKGEAALGSFHSLELPYIFGALDQPQWSWLKFSRDDQQLSDQLQTYWTNFAKTGNPNGAGLPVWPVFERKTQVVLEAGKDAAIGSRPSARPVFCDIGPGVIESRLRAH